MRRIYLDHTATTPLDPRVLDAMTPFFSERFGNASSIHAAGRESRAALDTARDTIAALLNARAGEITFTSGGTEANNTALKGAARKMRAAGKSHIVTAAAEHHAVLEPCRYLAEEEGFGLRVVPVDGSGRVHPDAVRAAIRPETGLVSVMHANNEVGTINDIAAISAVAHEAGALMHSDAVQSFGKLPVDVRALCVDLLTVSAHKIYGPKGIGGLFIRRGVGMERLLHGGGQERGMRAGTENVPAAVGFACAARLMKEEMETEQSRLRLLREELKRLLTRRFPSLRVNGDAENSLANIVNVSFRSDAIEIDGEALLFNLDLAGVAATSGSACTSGSMAPSHVLLAMGVDETTAKATLRFSFGRGTTVDDIREAADRLEVVVGSIGRIRPGRNS